MREPKNHKIKCLREYFDPVQDGQKKFEIRRNDRDYRVGDTVELECFEFGDYTGEVFGPVEIDYILFGGNYGLMSDHVIFSWKSI